MDEALDSTNRKILHELVANARIPVTELARKVGLSKTPVALRIRQMEEMGLITGYRAILSPLQLGLTHVTYVEARLSTTVAVRVFDTGVQTANGDGSITAGTMSGNQQHAAEVGRFLRADEVGQAEAGEDEDLGDQEQANG